MKFVVALALSVTLSSTFAYADTTITSLNVLTSVDGERGVLTSVSYPVPGDAAEIHIRLNIPMADYEDTLNAVSVRIYMLIDGAWTLGPAMTWAGGPRVGTDGSVNPAPTLNMQTFDPFGGPNGELDLRGRDVRVEVEPWRAMRLGATIFASKP